MSLSETLSWSKVKRVAHSKDKRYEASQSLLVLLIMINERWYTYEFERDSYQYVKHGGRKIEV